MFRALLQLELRGSTFLWSQKQLQGEGKLTFPTVSITESLWPGYFWQSYPTPNFYRERRAQKRLAQLYLACSLCTTQFLSQTCKADIFGNTKSLSIENFFEKLCLFVYTKVLLLNWTPSFLLERQENFSVKTANLKDNTSCLHFNSYSAGYQESSKSTLESIPAVAMPGIIHLLIGPSGLNLQECILSHQANKLNLFSKGPFK